MWKGQFFSSSCFLHPFGISSIRHHHWWFISSTIRCTTLKYISLDIHQAGYQQTGHNLVSSLSGSHQQSVMAAHVAGLMSVARFFVEWCPVVSSLVAKLKLWASHSGADDSLWQLCYLCLVHAWWLHLFFALVKWPRLAIGYNGFKCSWQFGKEDRLRRLAKS